MSAHALGIAPRPAPQRKHAGTITQWQVFYYSERGVTEIHVFASEAKALKFATDFPVTEILEGGIEHRRPAPVRKIVYHGGSQPSRRVSEGGRS